MPGRVLVRYHFQSPSLVGAGRTENHFVDRGHGLIQTGDDLTARLGGVAALAAVVAIRHWHSIGPRLSSFRTSSDTFASVRGVALTM